MPKAPNANQESSLVGTITNKMQRDECISPPPSPEERLNDRLPPNIILTPTSTTNTQPTSGNGMVSKIDPAQLALMHDHHGKFGYLPTLATT